MNVLGVWRMAHDPAKVEDQVQFLARTLGIDRDPATMTTPMSDGLATGCNPV